MKTIIVTAQRSGATLTGKIVPFVMFGHDLSEQIYNEVIDDFSEKGSLSYEALEGAHFTPDTPADAEKLKFKFGDGSNSDRVVLESQDPPYPYLIKRLSRYPRMVRGIKISLSDSSHTSQFDNYLKVIGRGANGQAELKESIIPNNFLTKGQQNKEIVEIPISFPLDGETSVVWAMKAVDTLKATISFMVE